MNTIFAECLAMSRNLSQYTNSNHKKEHSFLLNATSLLHVYLHHFVEKNVMYPVFFSNASVLNLKCMKMHYIFLGNFFYWRAINNACRELLSFKPYKCNKMCSKKKLTLPILQRLWKRENFDIFNQEKLFLKTHFAR